jgi:hypothetical protein
MVDAVGGWCVVIGKATYFMPRRSTSAWASASASSLRRSMIVRIPKAASLV